MKKLMIAVLLMSGIAAQAQDGTWTKPQDNDQEKGYLLKRKKPDADKKYMAGAVPEEDGHVIFRHQVNAPGKSVAEVYDKVVNVLQGMAHEENQIKSQVAIVNEATREIGATFEEWMTFKSTALVLDRTRFYYTVHVKCDDGRATVDVTRLRYLYEEERSPMRLTAEEWISDAKALNKKQTKLLPGSAKFRRKTVDRMEVLFNKIDAALK
jgi:colicin import membrane protein